MGVVCKTCDTKLNPRVARKFFLPYPGQDEENKKRFIHEVKAPSALNPPNLATIYEAPPDEKSTGSEVQTP
jgi:hypothetical protein